MECELIDILGNHYNENVTDKIEMPLDFSLRSDFFSHQHHHTENELPCKRVKISVDPQREEWIQLRGDFIIKAIANSDHSQKEVQLDRREILNSYLYLQSDLQNRFKDDGSIERKTTRKKIQTTLNGYRDILEATHHIDCKRKSHCIQ